MRIDLASERVQIVDAIERLLIGAPNVSDGNLTIVSLAREANVPRAALTHRHLDLKAAFYDRVQNLGRELPVITELRATVFAQSKRIKEQEQLIVGLEQEIALWARLNRALSIERAYDSPTGNPLQLHVVPNDQ